MFRLDAGSLSPEVIAVGVAISNTPSKYVRIFPVAVPVRTKAKWCQTPVVTVFVPTYAVVVTVMLITPDETLIAQPVVPVEAPLAIMLLVPVMLVK